MFINSIIKRLNELLIDDTGVWSSSRAVVLTVAFVILTRFIAYNVAGLHDNKPYDFTANDIIMLSAVIAGKVVNSKLSENKQL